MTGIICIIDLNFIPYLNKYMEILTANNEEFEVIFWKRMKNEDSFSFNTVEFVLETDLSKGKASKIVGFMKYRNFLTKTLKSKNYDRLIVLSTLAGALISDVLTRDYKNKFIFDIRDYTYEHFWLFRKIENKVIKASYMTVLSSDGFRSFLPNSDKYILCHNFLSEEIDENRVFKKEYESELKLTFIGAVRHFEIDKSVVDAFSNDNRFKVIFHGYGATYEKLLNYCQNRNVKLTGRYYRNQKADLLDDANIINSYYDHSKIVNKYAISNKFYDAAIYRKPLWANPETFMGKLAIEKGIGIDCSIDPNKMFIEYEKIDEQAFDQSCRKVVDEIMKDEDVFVNKMSLFLKSNNLEDK